ncbi:hypothetical protein HYPSUDRAFT_205418 [Hypholoma sublateritium FD-334 SS-4]|uniref:Uncharacterized protein n=1 Tax=Hypholoma sublateritium (strain FD-334 SS-4) TaxID=945553 RepID=A0A0D2NHL5_HYPSF|nr:hypothetical protein HYPSUDRAFT_205418 [Hypholoma sublateritium FD-334 SS-4]
MTDGLKFGCSASNSLHVVRHPAHRAASPTPSSRTVALSVLFDIGADKSCHAGSCIEPSPSHSNSAPSPHCCITPGDTGRYTPPSRAVVQFITTALLIVSAMRSPATSGISTSSAAPRSSRSCRPPSLRSTRHARFNGFLHRARRHRSRCRLSAFALLAVYRLRLVRVIRHVHLPHAHPYGTGLADPRAPIALCPSRLRELSISRTRATPLLSWRTACTRSVSYGRGTSARSASPPSGLERIRHVLERIRSVLERIWHARPRRWIPSNFALAYALRHSGLPHRITSPKSSLTRGPLPHHSRERLTPLEDANIMQIYMTSPSPSRTCSPVVCDDAPIHKFWHTLHDTPSAMPDIPAFFASPSARRVCVIAKAARNFWPSSGGGGGFQPGWESTHANINNGRDATVLERPPPCLTSTST